MGRIKVVLVNREVVSLQRSESIAQAPLGHDKVVFIERWSLDTLQQVSLYVHRNRNGTKDTERKIGAVMFLYPRVDDELRKGCGLAVRAHEEESTVDVPLGPAHLKAFHPYTHLKPMTSLLHHRLTNTLVITTSSVTIKHVYN